jgi:tRNA U55 pseudouridine synthase TruB
VTLDQVARACEEGDAARYLVPADRVLQGYPALHLDTTGVERVMHGNAFRYDGEAPAALARVYDPLGRFLALATWDAEHGLWQPKKVFI